MAGYLEYPASNKLYIINPVVGNAPHSKLFPTVEQFGFYLVILTHPVVRWQIDVVDVYLQ